MNKHAAPTSRPKRSPAASRPTSATIPRTSMSPAQAVYIDDMPEPAGTLHGCLGLSTVAHGTITSIDLSAVRAAPGVVDVLTAQGRSRRERHQPDRPP